MATTLTSRADRAWRTAAHLHADLCAGISPDSVPGAARLDPGEWALRNFFLNDHLTYSRYVTPAGVRVHRPGRTVFGSAQWVAVQLGASVIRDTLDRRQARKASQPRWTTPELVQMTVSDRRLHVDVSGHRVLFDYAATSRVEPDLRSWSVTLRLTTRTEPLRLIGPWAPWVAVYLAHRVYGTADASRMPALAPLR